MIRRPQRSTRTDTLVPYPTLFRSVDLCAEATGDHQWIHVDPGRARAASPFGGPIAHGYLTLALSNLFLPKLLAVPAASAGVNYGTGKVRFPAPVPVGSRIPGGAEIATVDEIPGGLQTSAVITVEVEGSEKPRSEERRGGQGCVSTCRFRWSRYH